MSTTIQTATESLGKTEAQLLYQRRPTSLLTGLTGGGVLNFDGIDVSNFSVGDEMEFSIAGVQYSYTLTTSGAAESSPTVIAPDSGGSGVRWILNGLSIGALTVGGNSITMAGGSSWVDSSGTATFAGATNGATLALGAGADGAVTITPKGSGVTQLGKIAFTSSADLYETATNGEVGIGVNYVGYNGGTTQFRNFVISDGKTNPIATFTGSTKLTTLAGNLTVSGTGGISSAGPAVFTAANAGAAGAIWAGATASGVYINAPTGNTVRIGVNNGDVVTVAVNEVTIAQSLTVSGTTTNIQVAEYADNAAAVGAGLAVGTVYRTGDVMKIVHA